MGSKLLKNFHLLLNEQACMTPIRVTSIFIYPIKSMGGIALNEVEVGMRGLQHDRRYMLVTEQGQFITQRQTPELGQFKLSYSADALGFKVDFLGDTLFIPFALAHDCSRMTAQVWDDFVEVQVASDAINQWFSEKLNRAVKLVYLPDDSARPIPEKHQPLETSTLHVSLADGYPILIVSEASLSDLNRRIAESNPQATAMEMPRFRPNLVLDSLEPHQEDNLGTFTLGTTTLQITKPCSRCVLTTIHPKTLERGDEPLRTLSTYRKVDNKIIFGANAICLSPGKIGLTH
jgi:uncharacterized protein YcbX